MRTIRPASLVILLAVAMLVRLDVAMAQGTDAQREACSGDAMRLCPEFVPDVNKITACMRKKSSELSAPCRQVMFGGGSHRHYKHHCRSNCA